MTDDGAAAATDRFMKIGLVAAVLVGAVVLVIVAITYLDPLWALLVVPLLAILLYLVVRKRSAAPGPPVM